jgi:hypothetical protein
VFFLFYLDVVYQGQLGIHNYQRTDVFYIFPPFHECYVRPVSIYCAQPLSLSYKTITRFVLILIVKREVFMHHDAHYQHGHKAPPKEINMLPMTTYFHEPTNKTTVIWIKSISVSKDNPHHHVHNLE